MAPDATEKMVFRKDFSLHLIQLIVKLAPPPLRCVQRLQAITQQSEHCNKVLKCGVHKRNYM